MTTVTADMLRRGRDLADLDSALKAEKDGLIFMETSPRAEPITLYSMADGEPIPMARNIAEVAIKKRYKGGGYLFTDRQEEAPAYKYGEVKCFLHPDSPEREVLSEVGMASKVCHSEHLASLYSKRIHAQRRHKDEWAAFTEYKNDLKEQASLDRQERQLEATLALAGKAANSHGSEWLDALEKAPGDAFVQAAAEQAVTTAIKNNVPGENHDCPACGWVNKKNTQQGLDIHARRWCPKKEGEDAVTE